MKSLEHPWKFPLHKRFSIVEIVSLDYLNVLYTKTKNGSFKNGNLYF